ncbi:MAG: hypothetical protein IH886_16695 [Nitrospinae bacterium]|nr:hypothetical protein [Nitrospinota bacterium]
MEFPRDEDNQIFAKFTNRIEKIVLQYEKLELPKGEKFEVTLYIIALQSLLTQCIELHDPMEKADGEKNILAKSVTAPPGLWGIHEELIKENTFNEKPFTYFKLLVHIRHALSHPTEQLKSYSTGYTTTGDDPSEKIKAFRFVHVPDKNRVFIIEIPVKTIRELVLGLSDFLTTANTK